MKIANLSVATGKNIFQEPTFLQASYIVPENEDPEFEIKSSFPFKAPSKRYCK